MSNNIDTMSDWTLIGLAAGMLTTLAFIPQIIKGKRSGSLIDISYMMLIMICTGMALWLTYGILESDIPIIFWNAVALTLNLSLIVLKFRSDKSSKRRKDEQRSS